ncbi:MAG: hypothetical protein GIKADHBN_01174 [Phycisphaerales bacterium]|nr:hypothetical protein [Phycisphaerales bacterium]
MRTAVLGHSLLVPVTLGAVVLAAAGGCQSAAATCPCPPRSGSSEHPLVEPGYPWRGTEHAVQWEAKEGPLQK